MNPSKEEIRGLFADAQMIGGSTADEARAVALVYRGALDQPAANVRSARVLATAHGIYELRVNGSSPDGSLMNPGWTSYEWRLMVQEHDVTEELRACDALRMDVLLGNGWYRGKWGFNGQRSDYGSRIGFIAVLEVVYADGFMQRVRTDARGGWRAYASPTCANSIYEGQTVDARIAWPGEPLGLEVVDFDRSALMPQEGPLVSRHETLRPQRSWKTPDGRTILDFGQNLVGWLRFCVRGEAGSCITLRHAEVVQGGELVTRPLRAATATDRLVCSGGEDFFEPTLTFHGFRYAEVSGWPNGAGPVEERVKAVAVRSDLRRTGWFSCSNAEVNKLVENSLWSQRGNFLSIPTDCPQRDEREGWTGDLAVFAPAAVFNYDCSGFLHRWLMDLAAETEHSPAGVVPVVVPDVIKLRPPEFMREWVRLPTAIWGDAAVWVPWALWMAYGDKDALAAHYPGMALHLASIERVLDEDGLWVRGFQFGDWLDPVAPAEHPEEARADAHVVAQICLVRTARMGAEAARVLGKKGDAERWGSLAERARAAFAAHYLHDGTIESDAPTVYALALAFGVLEGAAQERAAARLAELVRAGGHTIMTGFAGTPYVSWALSENGYVEDAYSLLLQRECPSWLYPVAMGATTTWERWDALLPTGEVNLGSMTSFNHYALGSVCDWIYQVVGGLRADAPGYARVRVEPRPGGGIAWAQTALDSPHGRIEVAWEQRDGLFSLEVTLPEGVGATVALPNGRVCEASSGTHRFGCEWEAL